MKHVLFFFISPLQGFQVLRKKMCDNELFPKDSLSLMSPEGPLWLHLS